MSNLLVASSIKDKAYYLGVVENLEKLEVSADTTVKLVQRIIANKQLNEISLAAHDAKEGRLDIENVKSLFQQFLTQGEEQQQEEKEDYFVSDDLVFLVDSTFKKPGLRWRLKTLNQMLGSLRKGDFGFIFARPETGKTTFLASETSFMAEQLGEEDGPILWFNNEEQSEKPMLRVIQASTGCDLTQLYGDLDGYNKKYQELTHGKLKIIKDVAIIHKSFVEKLCRRYKPSLIIFDQIDKIVGFDADREDLKLGAIYQWARELAKQYAPVIAVCQADGTGEGVKWLTMSNVANAKCLSPTTKVLMYDGRWKQVQHIKKGEQVMGPDNTPRNVLDVSFGTAPMYSITHKIGGDSYCVNEDHILSLIKNNNGTTQYLDIPIKEYLKIPCKTPYFGYRVGYELPEMEFPIDPYYLGLWLGDGKATAPEITTMDQEIKDYVKIYAETLGCIYVEWQNGNDNPALVQAKIKYKQGVKHPLLEKLRTLGIFNNKRIPREYFRGSQAQRLQLIAGLIDTDGTLVHRKHFYYSFTNKNYLIAFGLKELALSCGLMSTIRQKGVYYYVSISGDLGKVPCRIARKKSTYSPIKKDVLRSSIDVHFEGEGDYAGILIDGDHRFIINNCIVTHNTSKQAEADWILGIGKVNDPGYDSVRYLHLSKNKLIGDEDTDPTQRHGRREVIINAQRARYEDIL